MNKGIYCDDHNNRFAPLAQVLTEQFLFVNASLDVRGDRRREPRAYVIQNYGTRKFSVRAGEIGLATPHVVKETRTGSGVIADVEFADDEQAAAWLKELRSRGNHVKVTRRLPGRRYFTEPNTVIMTFGGSVGLRAVGYVALTFLAHAFPAVARLPDLRAFKDYVCGKESAKYVAWDWADNSGDEEPNRFQFGHRVAISATSASTRAHVSFFSTLSFAVDYGLTVAGQNQSVTFDIDPHAEHPPHDLHIIYQDQPILIEPIVEAVAKHSQAIQSGLAQSRFANLGQRIAGWEAQRNARDLLPRLTAAHDRADPYPEILDALEGQEQRLLNVLLFTLRGMKAELEKDPEAKALVAVVAAFTRDDAETTTGLSQPIEAFLHAFKFKLGSGLIAAART